MKKGCPPSSPAFEERRVKKQNQSEGPLSKSQQQLVVEHLRLVESTAANVARSRNHAEDLVSHGHVGLVRAAHLFDPSLGVPFAAFAAMHIRWAMLKGLRTERRQRRGQVPEEVLDLEALRESRCGTRVDPSFGPIVLDAEEQALETEWKDWLRTVVGTAVGQLRLLVECNCGGAATATRHAASRSCRS